MLSGQITDHTLRQQYNSLWPEQADISQRLFAMAYDSVAMLSNITQLSMIPGKRFNGLTGQLSITSDGQVNRHLNWAQYKDRQIQAVQLETTAPLPLFMQSASTVSDSE